RDQGARWTWRSPEKAGQAAGQTRDRAKAYSAGPERAGALYRRLPAGWHSSREGRGPSRRTRSNEPSSFYEENPGTQIGNPPTSSSSSVSNGGRSGPPPSRWLEIGPDFFPGEKVAL